MEFNVGAVSTAAVPPTDTDVQAVLALMRARPLDEVAGEAAHQLLDLAGREPHPAVKSALLARAGRLLAVREPGRALGVLRESFRLSPTLDAGRLLRQLAEHEPGFGRLRRLGHLADALSDLADGADAEHHHLEAVRTHLQQGHGEAALRALDRLRASFPEHPEAFELQDFAAQQRDNRAEVLQAQRQALAEVDSAERGGLLLAYAELLLAGEESPADIAAVLAEAMAAGAPMAEVVPPWLEVARALGDGEGLVRALAAALDVQDAEPMQRLRWADELANLPDVERRAPQAVARALEVLAEAMPEDPALRARRDLARVLADASPAEQEARLDALREAAARARDREAELVFCVALGQAAEARGDSQTAERHFRRVRTLSPEAPAALDFFERWYRTAGDHKRLLAALSQRLALVDGSEAVRIASEIGSLCEGPLASPERAMEAWQRVLAVQPGHLAAAAALAQHLRRLSRWPELLELCQRTAVAHAALPETAAVWWWHVAELHQPGGPLAHAERYESALAQVLAAHPDHAAARTARVAAARSRGDSATAADLLEQAAAAGDAEAGLQAAEIHRTAGRLDDAARCLQTVLELDPASQAAGWREDVARQVVELRRQQHTSPASDETGAPLLAALVEWLTALWQCSPAEVAWQQVVARTPSERRSEVADALTEAAGLAELGGGPELAFLLAQLAYPLQPTSLPTLALVRRLSTEPERASTWAAQLEATAEDGHLNVDVRALALAQLATLHLEVWQQPDRAEQTLARLRTLAPDSTELERLTTRLLVTRGDLDGLTAQLPTTVAGRRGLADALVLAAAAQPPAERARSLAAAAVALVDDAPEQASRWWVESLAASPDRAVAETLLARAHATPHREAALAVLVDLSDPSEALMWRLQWLELAPQLERAIELADDLLVAERWSELGVVVRRYLELAEGTHEAELVASRVASWAELATDRATSRELALTAARRAHGVDWGVVRAAVESGLRHDPEHSELLALRQQACAEQEDIPGLVETLERQAALTSGTAQADLWLRAADLCDPQAGAAEQAVRLYRQVLAARPEAWDAHAGLHTALRALGHAEALVEALGVVLASAGAGRHLLAAAALELLELSDELSIDRALELVLPVVHTLSDFAELTDAERELVMALDGRVVMAEASSQVAAALGPVAQRHNMAPVALRCLAVVAKAEPDPALRTLRLLALSELHAVEGDAAAAWRTARTAWLTSPTDATAAAAAEARADAVDAGDDFDLTLLALAGEAVLDDAPAVAEPGLRAGFLRRRAERAVRRGDGATAAQTYTLLAALEPTDVAALDALELLYREAGDWEAAALALSQRLERTSEREERVGLTLRLAALQADELADPKGAVEVLEQEVQRDPAPAELWSALLAHLRELGDRTRLVAVLDQRLHTHVAEPEERALLQRELAGLLQEGGEVAQSARHWLAAAEQDPTDEAAVDGAFEGWLAAAALGGVADLADLGVRLAQVLSARDEHERVVVLATVAAETNPSAPAWTRVADLREQQLGDPAGALEAWAHVLRWAPQDPAAVAAIARLASAVTEVAPVAAVLLDTADVLTTPAERRARRLLVLGLLPSSTEPLRRRVFEALLVDDPQDQLALEGLGQWAAEAGDVDAQLALLEARQRTASVAEQPGLALERAQVALAAERESDAVVALHAVVAMADAEARQQAAALLCELHERAGRHLPHAEALLVLRSCHQDPEAQRHFGLAAAAALMEAGAWARAEAVLDGEAEAGPDDAALFWARDALFSRVAQVSRATEDAPDHAAAIASRLTHLERGWRHLLCSDAEARERAALAWLALRTAADPEGDGADALFVLIDAGVRGAGVREHLDRRVANDDVPAARCVVDLCIAQTASADAASRAAALADELQARLLLAAQTEAPDEVQQMRSAAAAILEELGDREAALGQWHMLLAAAGWQADAVAQALRIAQDLAAAPDTLELLASVAAGIADDAGRTAARLTVATEAALLGHQALAADVLDAVLAETPGHAPAWLLRGEVLSTLPDWHHGERMAAHWRHGIEYADATQRAMARLALARLLHEHLGQSVAGLDLMLAAGEEWHDEQHLSDRVAVTTACATGADGAEAVLGLARSLAGRAAAVELAAWAAGHDAAWQPAAADRHLLLALADRAASERPAQAVELLQTLLLLEPEAAERGVVVRRLTGLAPAAAAAGATLDPVALTRELALAEPAEPQHWDALLAADAELGQQTLAVAAEQTDEPALKHTLLARAGLAAVDPDLALAWLRMALEVEERTATRAALQERLAAAGRHQELALDLEAAAEQTPALAGELWTRAAALWAGPAKEPARALELYRKLQALRSDDPALGELYLTALQSAGDPRYRDELNRVVAEVRAGGDRQRLVRLLGQQLEGPGTLDDVHAVVTELRALGEVERTLSAVSVLAARQADLAPGQQRDVATWRLADTDPEAAPAAWAEAQLAALEWVDAMEARQRGWLALAYHIQARMADPEAALAWLLQALPLPEALQTLPTWVQAPEAARLALTALASHLPDPAVLAAGVALAQAHQLEAAEGAPFVQASLQQRQSEVWALHGAARESAAVAWANDLLAWAGQGQPEAAEAGLELLLSLVPDAVEPVELLALAGELAKVAGRLDQWTDAVTDLVGTDRLPPGMAKPALGLVASVLADAGQPARAADVWLVAWDADPDDTDARDAVLALRREARDPRRLAADLERALLLGGADVQGLRLELADLRAQAGHPREALRLVLDVLTREPGHAEALAAADLWAGTPTVMDEALTALAPIYRQAGDAPRLQAVLERQLTRPTFAGRRTEISDELAGLLASSSPPPPAAGDSWLAALRSAPSLAKLAAVEEAAADQPDVLAEAYALWPTLQLAPDDVAAGLERAAAWAEATDRIPLAEGSLHALALLRPTSPEAIAQSQLAFEQLDAKLEFAERWPELLDLLQLRAMALVDVEERRPVLHRLAGLARATGHVEAARQALRDLCALDPQDAGPREGLVELERAHGEPKMLLDALTAWAVGLPAGRVRAEAWAEAARLHLQVAQSDRATDCYQEAFRADPALDEPFVYLDREARREHRNLDGLYLGRAQALPPGPGRTLAWRKLAQVRTDRGDIEGAVQALAAAFADDPDNGVVRDELLRLAEQQRAWPVWLQAAEAKLAAEQRPEAMLDLRAHVAQVALVELDDVPLATRHHALLLAQAPDAAVTRHVAALLRAHSSDAVQAAAGLEQLLRETDDPASEVVLRQRLGELYAGPLDEPQKAVREFQKVLTLDPKRWHVRRALCDVFKMRDSTEALAESLRQWLAAKTEGDGRSTLRMQMGSELTDLHVELGQTLVLLGELREAIDVLRRAYVLGGDSEMVNGLLISLYEQVGDPAGALPLVEWQAAQETGAASRDLWLHAGQLAERARKWATARDIYRKQAEQHPDDDEVALGVARAHAGLGETDRALRLFDEVARKSTAAAALRADALVGMGRCRAERGQTVQAKALYEEALRLVPDHLQAQAALRSR
jgi:hypothetical protein